MIFAAKPSLLGLPAETRNQIYNDFFDLHDIFTARNLEFLLTCHQIYEEACIMAVSRTTFKVAQPNPKRLRKKLLALDKTKRLAISSLQLPLPALTLPKDGDVEDYLDPYGTGYPGEKLLLEVARSIPVSLQLTKYVPGLEHVILDLYDASDDHDGEEVAWIRDNQCANACLIICNIPTLKKVTIRLAHADAYPPPLHVFPRDFLIDFLLMVKKFNARYMAFAPKRKVLYEVESTSTLSFNLPLKNRQTEGVREVEICITAENESLPELAEHMEEDDNEEYDEHAVNAVSGVGVMAIH